MSKQTPPIHADDQALTELLATSREALAKALPTALEKSGKTYALQFSIGLALVEVFDSDGRPIVKSFFDCIPKPKQTPEFQSRNLRTYQISQLFPQRHKAIF